MAATDEAEVIRQLKRLIELDGSLRRAADALKVSPAYLSAVVNRKREIGPKILKALRLRRVVTFEELPIPDKPRAVRLMLEGIRRRPSPER